MEDELNILVNGRQTKKLKTNNATVNKCNWFSYIFKEQQSTTTNKILAQMKKQKQNKP